MHDVTLNPEPHGHRFRSRFLIVLLCSLVVLAGCGAGDSVQDDEGHRFATERQPTAVPTATPDEVQVATDEVSPTAEPTASAGDLMLVRGAPQFAYFVVDGHLQVYDSGSRQFTVIGLPADTQLLDFAASPTGDRVGVLALTGEDVAVHFYGADGQALGEPIRLPISPALAPGSAESSPVASPVASPVSTPGSSIPPPRLRLTWVPQGNAVLVAGPGVLQRVSMSGEVMPVSRAGVTGSVNTAFWSPMDSQVAIVTRHQDGQQRVFLLDSGRAEAVELTMLQLDPGEGLSNMQWLPTGRGFVLVEGPVRNGELMNGQLYQYVLADEVPTLLATSGQGGPAGTISHAAVSPDGQSVAYVIMVRDQEDWFLHSVWVRTLDGRSALSVPFSSNSPVTGLLWTAEGLVWQQQDGSITIVDSSLQPRPLGEEPQATPVATPDATPIYQATPKG